MTRHHWIAAASICAVSGLTLSAAPTLAQPAAHPGVAAAAAGATKPPLEKVVEGLTKVVTPTDGAAPLYELYTDKEKGKLIAVLPARYADQTIMLAGTISAGDAEAGVMGPTAYAKWRKVGDTLVLVAPDLFLGEGADAQAKASKGNLSLGTVLAALPILTETSKGQPVVDLGSLVTSYGSTFFAASPFGGYGPAAGALNPALARITKVKAFPENVLYEYELPRKDGRLIRVTYSISELKGTPGFKPRKADSRVGYFYDWSQDFGQTDPKEITSRLITRWNIEKADPSLEKSPPKQPIVWYIEHTTPVKYRRYVREGILMWNKAFEEVGIVGALEVYQQDASTGAHMDKDPEDARHNFFRWNASDQGYAIGPSRTNPYTGEILDADVVWHQGLTRAIRGMLENISDDLVAQSFDPETLAWFDEFPHWDPRVRLSSPALREQRLAERKFLAQKAATSTLDEKSHPWAHNLHAAGKPACSMGNMLSVDFALTDAALAAGMLAVSEGEAMLDDLPEQFVGDMIRYISAHEVGHCLGLQHNMAASTIRTIDEINTPGFHGATVGSVMDYVAVNLNTDEEKVQGPYASREVGPYDRWAIAYGYGPEDKLPEVLKKVSEPEHIYISQIAMSVGSDPRNMTWDFGANNLDFSEHRLKIVRELRGKLISDIVRDGEPWAEARRRYAALLGTHLQALFVASPWIGGSYTNNDAKGDPGSRTPVEDVAAADQRRALALIMDNAFEDDAFGLTPELVRHMGKEYWWDNAGFTELVQDPSFTVHDSIAGIQATALTLVMNPTRLRRIYDNEFRINGSEPNPLTVAEVLDTVTSRAWAELETRPQRQHSAADPMISSFRRNLQREHVQRLVDLALLPNSNSPAVRTISTLSTLKLRELRDSIAQTLGSDALDPYTKAHLTDAAARINKALEAQYIIRG